MPYILPKDRERLDPKINELLQTINSEQRAGELNYIITKLTLGLTGEGRYKDYNELIGALECAKQEFYRRKISPYEDQKAKDNSDVY